MKYIYLVINDIRSIPLAAVINIHYLFGGKEKVQIILSKRMINNIEYGQYLPVQYKRLVASFFIYIYRAILIRENPSTVVDDQEIWGVTSSLQSITCDSQASRESYSKLYKSLFEQALGAKEVFNYISSQQDVGCVILFNGRTASSHPIARGCFNRNIKVFYYEYSSSSNGYRLYPYAPHSFEKLGLDLCKFRRVSISSIPSLLKSGSRWANNKLSNEFTKFYQNNEVIPHEVIVFLGSDHEYTCLDEDICGLKFKGNYHLVNAAIQKYGNLKSIAIRAHPNQAQDISYQQTLLPIIDLCNKHNVTFYGPSSNISSYELIKKSHIVMAEYSSIAIDAVLLGKDVDIIGNLDLKVILLEANKEYLMNREESKQYISEVLSLYEDMYFMKFTFLQLSCFRLGFWIETFANKVKFQSIKITKYKT